MLINLIRLYSINQNKVQWYIKFFCFFVKHFLKWTDPWFMSVFWVLKYPRHNLLQNWDLRKPSKNCWKLTVYYATLIKFMKEKKKTVEKHVTTVWVHDCLKQTFSKIFVYWYFYLGISDLWTMHSLQGWFAFPTAQVNPPRAWDGVVFRKKIHINFTFVYFIHLMYLFKI